MASIHSSNSGASQRCHRRTQSSLHRDFVGVDAAATANSFDIERKQSREEFEKMLTTNRILDSSQTHEALARAALNAAQMEKEIIIECIDATVEEKSLAKNASQLFSQVKEKQRHHSDCGMSAVIEESQPKSIVGVPRLTVKHSSEAAIIPSPATAAAQRRPTNEISVDSSDEIMCGMYSNDSPSEQAAANSLAKTNLIKRFSRFASTGCPGELHVIPELASDVITSIEFSKTSISKKPHVELKKLSVVDEESLQEHSTAAAVKNQSSKGVSPLLQVFESHKFSENCPPPHAPQSTTIDESRHPQLWKPAVFSAVLQLPKSFERDVGTSATGSQGNLGRQRYTDHCEDEQQPSLIDEFSNSHSLVNQQVDTISLENSRGFQDQTSSATPTDKVLQRSTSSVQFSGKSLEPIKKGSSESIQRSNNIANILASADTLQKSLQKTSSTTSLVHAPQLERSSSVLLLLKKQEEGKTTTLSEIIKQQPINSVNYINPNSISSSNSSGQLESRVFLLESMLLALRSKTDGLERHNASLMGIINQQTQERSSYIEENVIAKTRIAELENVCKKNTENIGTIFSALQKLQKGGAQESTQPASAAAAVKTVTDSGMIASSSVRSFLGGERTPQTASDSGVANISRIASESNLTDKGRVPFKPIMMNQQDADKRTPPRGKNQFQSDQMNTTAKSANTCENENSFNGLLQMKQHQSSSSSLQTDTLVKGTSASNKPYLAVNKTQGNLVSSRSQQAQQQQLRTNQAQAGSLHLSQQQQQQLSSNSYGHQSSQSSNSRTCGVSTANQQQQQQQPQQPQQTITRPSQLPQHSLHRHTQSQQMQMQQNWQQTYTSPKLQGNTRGEHQQLSSTAAVLSNSSFLQPASSSSNSLYH